MSKNKKYELLENNTYTLPDGKILKRIRALRAIPAFDVKAGDLGGYVESEENLSIIDNAWVADEAKVYEHARVYGNARVYGDAHVFGWAKVAESARVYGNARVSIYAHIVGKAQVLGNAQVSGMATIFGNAIVSGDAVVSGNAVVHGDSKVSGDARLSGDSKVSGDAHITLKTHIGWFSGVGEENGNDTLTWFRAKKGVMVNYGYSSMTLEEFEKRIHTTQLSHEYQLLIDFIRLRSASFTYEGGEVKPVVNDKDDVGISRTVTPARSIYCDKKLKRVAIMLDFFAGNDPNTPVAIGTVSWQTRLGQAHNVLTIATDPEVTDNDKIREISIILDRIGEKNPFNPVLGPDGDILCSQSWSRRINNARACLEWLKNEVEPENSVTYKSTLVYQYRALSGLDDGWKDTTVEWYNRFATLDDVERRILWTAPDAPDIDNA